VSLEYVCWKQEVYFARVDAKVTSQTVLIAAPIPAKKTLDQRMHKCEHCSYKAERCSCCSSGSSKRISSRRHMVVKLAEGAGKGSPNDARILYLRSECQFYPF